MKIIHLRVRCRGKVTHSTVKNRTVKKKKKERKKEREREKERKKEREKEGRDRAMIGPFKNTKMEWRLLLMRPKPNPMGS